MRTKELVEPTTHPNHSPNLAASDSDHSFTGIPPYKRIADELLHSIDVVADFEEGVMTETTDSPPVKWRRTWVAIKMTALVPDARAILTLSLSIVESRKDLRTPAKYAVVSFPGSPRIENVDVTLKPSSTDRPTALTHAEISSVWELYDNLVNICTRAQERGIKIVIDAEYRYVFFKFRFPIFHIFSVLIQARDTLR
jgi:proline dehydrogenase